MSTSIVMSGGDKDKLRTDIKAWMKNLEASLLDAVDKGVPIFLKTKADTEDVYSGPEYGRQLVYAVYYGQTTTIKMGRPAGKPIAKHTMATRGELNDQNRCKCRVAQKPDLGTLVVWCECGGWFVHGAPELDVPEPVISNKS